MYANLIQCINNYCTINSYLSLLINTRHILFNYYSNRKYNMLYTFFSIKLLYQITGPIWLQINQKYPTKSSRFPIVFFFPVNLYFLNKKHSNTNWFKKVFSMKMKIVKHFPWKIPKWRWYKIFYQWHSNYFFIIKSFIS